MTVEGEVLRSRRLQLRPLTTRDAEVIASLAGDWDVARMTAGLPHPYSATEAFRWLASIESGEIVRAIVADEVFVGVCGAAPNCDVEDRR